MRIKETGLTNGDLIMIEKGGTILLVMSFGYNINPYKTYSDNLAISDLYELLNSYRAGKSL